MAVMKSPIPDKPKLRRGLAAAPDPNDAGFAIIYDQRRISRHHLRIQKLELTWLHLMDGERSIDEIHAVATRAMGGVFPRESIVELVIHLETGLFLEGPRLESYLNGPIREPSCIGCYHGDPVRLRRQIRDHFTRVGGPGLPARHGTPGSDFRALLAPHIDYTRGNVSFAWGFKELCEQTEASLFVIIATSHYSRQRFTLTRKHFQTPLGVAETDQSYIDRLVQHYGDGLFDDPIAHLPEHSIELEVVYLQYLYEGVRPIRIVPLLVGSFADCVHAGCEPTRRDDIRRMVSALRAVESETTEPVAYVISGDLAHIGPKFGDSDPVADPFLEHSRKQDQALLACAERADAGGYFQVIAQELDERRICGLPPTYTFLEAVRPARGKLLHYGQYVHPDGFESVSFASVGFYSRGT
jgi:hypothetical protein